MSAGYRVTILGSGSSSGVPRVGGDWGACDPKNPRNRRRRCAALVERGATAVLVDTPPDLREQLLDAEVKRLDAVLFTHEHADQAHGIDDLRAIALLMRKRVPVHADPRCMAVLRRRFDYCFEALPGTGYPAILDPRLIEDLAPVVVGTGADAITAIPFAQDHGGLISLGFRFGPVAYSADVVDLDDRAFAALDGVKVWIVDALRWTPHPTHAHVDKALAWLERAGVERGVLTNLHIDLDYEVLKARLPAHVEPAYDGMVIEV